VSTDDILSSGTVAERAALFASWPNGDGDFWPSAYYEIAYLHPLADRLAARPMWGWQAYANAAAIRTITRGES
jgi:hypothetical protein